MTDKAILEAAARALCRIEQHPEARWHAYTARAEAVLFTVTPLIEAAALERAARAMDRDDWSTWEEVVAAVTRALKEKP